MRTGGHATASLDILKGDPKPGKQDCMNLLSDSGFALLASNIQWPIMKSVVQGCASCDMKHLILQLGCCFFEAPAHDNS